MGSISTPHKVSNYDEIFMQRSLQFAESLKVFPIYQKSYHLNHYFVVILICFGIFQDLKVLKNQLYSAAEYFESSYDKDDHQILYGILWFANILLNLYVCWEWWCVCSVMESSKDYVTKAVVSTVDHLGSIADKLNKFLDEKADEFSATSIRFSCIQQVQLL